MDATPTQWAVVTASVRGASHGRDGRPNQDAVASWVDADGTRAVLAVADGHGSEHSFRSDAGSTLAVGVAVRFGRKFLDGLRNASVEVTKDAAERLLPADLARAWIEAVDAHLATAPYTPDELARIGRGGKPAADRPAGPDLARVRPYGSTLLVVLVSDAFTAYLQLGDGDLLAVGDDGVGRPALARDASLMANETTSLCMDKAHRLFRTRFVPARDGQPPRLVMASTDGYSNSFETEADFAKVAADLLGSVRTEGVAAVEAALPGWLDEASVAGSGDDVTVGLLYRAEEPTQTGLPASAGSGTANDVGGTATR